MIDLGVVNDLPDNKQPAIFENFARSIRKIDGALDAVAKTELLRQPHSGVADRDDSTSSAHFIDNVAAIMRFDLLLHRRHYIWRTEVHLLACSCAAGNQVRAHVVVVILGGTKNPGPVICENLFLPSSSKELGWMSRFRPT